MLFVSDMLSFSTFPTFILKCVLITDRYERLNKYDCIVIIFYNYMYIILLHLSTNNDVFVLPHSCKIEFSHLNNPDTNPSRKTNPNAI